MRIVSCHIENFGKLHDYSVDFTAKENRICQENGWGKSTFAAFVRAMFYGLEGKRKQKIEENEYTRYTPWQGGVFGGKLTFETKGKQYTITRTFGSSESFELRDAITNIVSTDYTERIGEELFQVNRESFMRTVFVGQNDCKTEATDDINSKIGNLTDSTNDLNSYEKADKTLKELMASLTPKRITGSIRKRADEITGLHREVTNGERLSESMAMYQRYIQAESEQLEKSKSEQNAVTKEQSRVAKIQAVQGKRDEWKNLQQNLAVRKEKLDEEKTYFPGQIPEYKDVAQYIEMCTTLERTKERMAAYHVTEKECGEFESMKNVFAQKQPQEEDIEKQFVEVRQLDKIKAELEKKQNVLATKKEIASAMAKNQKSLSPLVIVGAVMAILGIVIMTVVVNAMAIGIAATVLGAGLAIYGFFGNRKVKEPEVPQEILDLESEIEDMQSKTEKMVQQIWDYLKPYEGLLGSYLKEERFADDLYTLKEKCASYKSLEDKMRQQEEARKSYAEAYDQIVSFISTYQFQVQENPRIQLNGIQEHVRNYQTALQLYNEARKQLEDFERNTDMVSLQEKVSAESLPSLEELEEKNRELSEKIDSIKKRIQEYQKSLEALQEQYDDWEEKKIRLAELLDLQEKEQQKYDTVEKTKLYLGLAKEAFTAKYAGPILEKFREYYELITGDTDTRFYIDANTNITVEEYGKQRETDTLSAGYRDLLAVCLRIAYVDAMYQDEKPMLIMDDPFVNLDDRKIEAAKKLLSHISENYQVLYFTCSEARR